MLMAASRPYLLQLYLSTTAHALNTATFRVYVLRIIVSTVHLYIGELLLSLRQHPNIDHWCLRICTLS